MSETAHGKFHYCEPITKFCETGFYSWLHRFVKMKNLRVIPKRREEVQSLHTNVCYIAKKKPFGSHLNPSATYTNTSASQKQIWHGKLIFKKLHCIFLLSYLVYNETFKTSRCSQRRREGMSDINCVVLVFSDSSVSQPSTRSGSTTLPTQTCSGDWSLH